jgi:hypothetical protein
VREIALGGNESPHHTAAACELVLEALVAQKRLSRNESGSYSRAQPRRPKGPGTQGPFGPPSFDV